MSEEMSFYSGNSPTASPRPCSISPYMDMDMLSPKNESEMMGERHDIDCDSKDSGFSSSSVNNAFTCVQPVQNSISPKSASCFQSYDSMADECQSMEDECMDLLEMEMDDNAQLPTRFDTIISGDIITTDIITKTPVFRKCLSMIDGNSANGNAAHTTEMLKSIPETSSSPFFGVAKTYKRAETPSVNGSPVVQCKRLKHDKENEVTRPSFRKSLSMNDEIIMNALSRCKYLMLLHSRNLNIPFAKYVCEQRKLIQKHFFCLCFSQ